MILDIFTIFACQQRGMTLREISAECGVPYDVVRAELERWLLSERMPFLMPVSNQPRDLYLPRERAA